jgi:alpha-N-acetylglucosaminidase
MIILDLISEINPVYNFTNQYFGKYYIFNELHNFGGNMGLYGVM